MSARTRSFYPFLLLLLLLLMAWLSHPSPTMLVSIADTHLTVDKWASSAQSNVAAEQVSMLIELLDPPVAQVYAASLTDASVQAAHVAASTQAHLAVVEAAQQQLLATLHSLGAQVLYRNQRVYNGIAVRIAVERAADLARLPDVKSVRPLLLKYPDDAHHSSWKASSLRGQAGNGIGVLGEGITIAVIDTGVDYLHTDFGGSGAGYATNDPTLIGDVAGFPGLKIVDGYDFAGNAYNANPQDNRFQPLPTPDADPMDCYAHGTHVAGIAAGYGVHKNGNTYHGPYDSTLAAQTLKILPGVAPAAQIYALKVFGCTGGSEIVDQAIEWAVDPNGDGDFADHVDVINLSLGSPYGSFDDPTAIAGANAVAAGVIVVASAGNSSDVHYVTGSPAVADAVISVAAGQSIPGEAGVSFEGVASFSARGPRRQDSALKPDLLAPGVQIVSASQGSGSGALALSGTSMAAPHVAGSMALLRQLYPTWRVEELKALVMNTAQPSIRTGEALTATQHSPVRVGAGRLDLANAVQTNVIAYNATNPDQTSISFGAPEVLVNATALEEVRIANKSDGVVTYTVAYTSVTTIPGVRFNVPTVPITVTAGGFVNFPVIMTADAAQMRHTRDATLSINQGGLARHWLGEAAGYLVLQPISGTQTTPLRVPIYAAPRPAAAIHALPAVLDFGSALQATQTITLQGVGITGTHPPTDVTSLVSALQLQWSSPDTAPLESVTPTEGSGADWYDHADLKYVGVTSDFAATRSLTNGAGGVAESMLYFGVVTYENWSTPNEVMFEVSIDTSLDGNADFVLFNTNQLGYNTNGLTSDSLITALRDLRTGMVTPQGPLNGQPANALDTAPFNTNVLLLPVRAGALGLTSAHAAFAYSVETYSNDRPRANNGTKKPVDRSPSYQFDLTQPGLVIRGNHADALPLYKDLPGESMTIGFDLAAYALSNTGGVLLLHHHNQSNQRAEIVDIRFHWPHSVYLPLVARR